MQKRLVSAGYLSNDMLWKAISLDIYSNLSCKSFVNLLKDDNNSKVSGPGTPGMIGNLVDLVDFEYY